MITQTFKLMLHSIVFISWLLCVTMNARAADLPTATSSPIAGISFDDTPLSLPVQRNFQMAMLTASSELGRSCGRMEAYGWRMDASEQDRANQIFNSTVDRMRAQGYAVESRSTSAVASDVTLFTADRTDRHLIALWSAGEIGLVMVLCETSAPLSMMGAPVSGPSELSPATQPSHMPMAQTIRSLGLGRTGDKPVQLTTAGRRVYEDFSPVGKWVGNYTCSQGTTGATLSIDSMKGDQFTGNFSFYPTSKNPYVPKGKYLVFGEYDASSQRILINPGKWINRPEGFFNTIMIGSFNPADMTFSGFFQGIMGCTSYEANRDEESVVKPPPVKKKVVKAEKKKKSKAKAKPKAALKVEKKVEEAKPKPEPDPEPLPIEDVRDSALEMIPPLGEIDAVPPKLEALPPMDPDLTKKSAPTPEATKTEDIIDDIPLGPQSEGIVIETPKGNP